MRDNILNDGLFSYDVYLLENSNILEENLIGCNQKETLIILTLNEQKEKTSKELLSFLKKILSAIGYELENDVAMIQVERSKSVQIADLKKSVKFKYLINFGMPLSNLGLNLENNFLYKPVTLNGVSIINANSLEEIQQNVNLKKHFWNCLKATFLN